MKYYHVLTAYAIAAILPALVSAHAGHQHHYHHHGDYNDDQFRHKLDSPITYTNGALNLEAINARLSQCEVIQELDYLSEAIDVEGSWIHKIFDVLFPFGPSVNSLLAVTYISGIPNLLLVFIPTNISPPTLSILVSFAVGGLLGDVFLHIIPQTFLSNEAHAGIVVVDERQNAILGSAMFLGLLTFVLVDKILRLVSSSSSNGESNSHSHSHSHSHHSHVSAHDEVEYLEGHSTSRQDKPEGDLKRRMKEDNEEEKEKQDTTDGITTSSSSTSIDISPKVKQSAIKESARTSAYLNVIADFSHNITDGLAMTASFFAGKYIGATTCLAIFCHEVPHQVGDFALLIQGGFSKPAALKTQFLTASGAYMGAIIGIVLNNFLSNTGGGGPSASSSEIASMDHHAPGLFGTNVMVSDLTLPFTAGGFLYIATVGVIPELLEADSENQSPLKDKLILAFKQTIAMVVGIGIMFAISWTE